MQQAGAGIIPMPLKQASQMNQCVLVLRIEIENLAVIVDSPEPIAARILYQAQQVKCLRRWSMCLYMHIT